jgi:hypothetical protein
MSTGESSASINSFHMNVGWTPPKMNVASGSSCLTMRPSSRQVSIVAVIA